MNKREDWWADRLAWILVVTILGSIIYWSGGWVWLLRM